MARVSDAVHPTSRGSCRKSPCFPIAIGHRSDALKTPGGTGGWPPGRRRGGRTDRHGEIRYEKTARLSDARSVGTCSLSYTWKPPRAGDRPQILRRGLCWELFSQLVALILHLYKIRITCAWAFGAFCVRPTPPVPLGPQRGLRPQPEPMPSAPPSPWTGEDRWVLSAAESAPPCGSTTRPNSAAAHRSSPAAARARRRGMPFGSAHGVRCGWVESGCGAVA